MVEKKAHPSRQQRQKWGERMEGVFVVVHVCLTTFVISPSTFAESVVDYVMSVYL